MRMAKWNFKLCHVNTLHLYMKYASLYVLPFKIKIDFGYYLFMINYIHTQ